MFNFIAMLTFIDLWNAVVRSKVRKEQDKNRSG